MVEQSNTDSSRPARKYEVKADHRAFPDNKPEQVQALVAALYALALRIKVLVDAREELQAALLVRELRADIRAWRALVEEQLRP